MIRTLFITEILIVVTQQARILSIPQVLLQTALRFRVDVALSAKKGEQHGEEDEGVGCSPEDEGDPDAEVVYVEDLLSR